MNENFQITREEMLVNVLVKSPRIYSLVNHVSQSGMMRTVRFFVAIDSRIEEVTGLIAAANRMKIHDNNGVIVKGCGFDAGQLIVSNLQFRLRRSGKITTEIAHERL